MNGYDLAAITVACMTIASIVHSLCQAWAASYENEDKREDGKS